MKEWDNDMLGADHEQILTDFLLKFLPAKHNARCYPRNELSAIKNALDKWFMRNYGFHIPQRALAEAFKKLANKGYRLVPKGEDYDPELKKSKVVEPNGEYRDEPVYREFEGWYIFVNIDSKVVALISRANTTDPSTTATVKVKALEVFQLELRHFLVTHLLRP